MTRAGLAKVGAEILSEDSPPEPKKKELVVPRYVEDALRANGTAWENFNNLAPSYRRHYVAWITDAKRDETRQKRLREAIEKLARNEKLGLK